MRIPFCLTIIVAFFFLAAGCLSDDDDDDSYIDDTGEACETDEQCYPGIDHELLAGEVVCMDRVEGGYCTHRCATDADCCAVPGECNSNHDQVCGPFESTGDRFCFLSCEDVEDEDNFCQVNAHYSFICRSTGGGSDNRKVCVPEG